MAELQGGQADTISAKLLQQLSNTRFACVSLVQLSSRPGNFVYRGVLAQPVTNPNNSTATSIIIKHSTKSDIPGEDSSLAVARGVFEELLFNSVAEGFQPVTGTTVIKAPRLYLYDPDTNTQMLEDFPDTSGFKLMLFSPNAKLILTPSGPAAIGCHVGSWLRSFHNWASAPAQDSLRAQLLQSDPRRELKRLITYDGFLGVLQNYPELMEGHQNTLEAIRDATVKEFEKFAAEEDENWGLIHGDFWSGNILLPTAGWQETPSEDRINEVFVIDWEFAQFGHRAYDLGQIVGDLYERKVYNGTDTGLPVVQGVIKGYGKLSDEMAFRVAMHVGVHLIGWYKRRPQRGPWMASEEAIMAGLTVGRDFLIMGWEKNKAFFQRTVLSPLFTTN